MYIKDLGENPYLDEELKDYGQYNHVDRRDLLCVIKSIWIILEIWIESLLIPLPMIRK